MAVLKRAGTVVCEPIHRFRLEAADTLSALLAILVQLHAVPEVSPTRNSWCTPEGNIPVARVHELRQQIPLLIRGEGVRESSFRPEPIFNPLNREEYLHRVALRGE
ncbi:MAG TPA: hypothetical protein VFE59_37440 [Trebonia sp.]|jgi:ribosomal protection tetracycline resistance protein|nr:hypothetical protein [Trebonia sp.]